MLGEWKHKKYKNIVVVNNSLAIKRNLYTYICLTQ